MLLYAYYCHILHRVKFETYEMPDAKLSPKSRLHFPGDEWRVIESGGCGFIRKPHIFGFPIQICNICEL
jgi:hypothetical protein